MFSAPVIDVSQVAEARRRACREAVALGFDETDTGRVAIVVTELATNVLRHGGGGEVLVDASRATGGGKRVLDILALDRGPGMADVSMCLRDGYSTAGSAGQGLGAVSRQAAVFEVFSRPGTGTAVLARVRARGAAGAAPAVAPDVTVGGICISVAGETMCGDNWTAAIDGRICTLLLADGLGHGPKAAEAADLAVATFAGHRTRAPAEALDAVHGALRVTRGAAVSIVRLDFAAGSASFAGIGNVAGTLVDGAVMRRMVSLNGTAGAAARSIRAFPYPMGVDALAVLHSDGLTSSWALDRYPGLRACDPALIAAVLYRDFARGRDDVTVVVAKTAAT